MPLPGDFGVVHVAGRAGRLIRLGQWLNGDGYADYEHAFLVIGNGQVVEARPSGAGYAPLDHYPDAAFYTCPDDHRVAVVRGGLGLVGTPYSWTDYFALAAVRFHLDLVAHQLRQRVVDSKELICSQLVDYAYQLGGVQLFDDGRLPGDVTPGDLHRLIALQSGTATTPGAR